MYKHIISFLLGAFCLYGIHSAKAIDNTIIHNYDDHEYPKPDSLDLATVYDTSFICAPTSDVHEWFIASHSYRLLAVENLGTDSINRITYSMEIQDGGCQVAAIDLDLFPNWHTADSIEGFNQRGKDSWCEVAKLKI
jgi:hypothetical protein